MADPLISFAGLASGIDSKSIIGAMVAFRARPIDLLGAQRTSFEQLKTRYEALRSKANLLRTAAKDIKNAKDLLSFTAKSSATAVLAATANGSAAPGSIAVNVTALAKAEVEGSNGFADFDTTNVGAGTLKVTVAGVAHDVVLDPTSNTLGDVRDAINAAGIGVSAQIVNTGIGATPYQLLITGDETGASNTVALDTTTSFTGTLAFTQHVAASNAALTINSIAFERETNVVDDVVAGVSLTLTATGATTVTISSDLEGIKAKLQKYVDTHNDLVNFINSEIKVSDISGNGGPFNGESAVRTFKDRLLSLHGQSGFPGGSLAMLSQVGVTLNNDGTLAFSGAKFDTAAAQDLDGVTALLTTKGDFVAHAGFQIQNVPDAVAAGTYAVVITQAAAKASGTAASAFSAPLAQDETLTIQSGSAPAVVVELAAGDDLAAALSKINGALSAAGVELSASDASGSIAFSATEHGTAHNFTVASDVTTGGSGVDAAGVSAANGKDVQGTIGGFAASGVGQVLTGNSGTATAGVALRHTGSAPASTTLTVGPDGFFVRMEAMLGDALTPISGVLDSRIDTLGDSIDGISSRMTSMEQRLEQYKEQLERRFSALESLMGQLQASQSFLALNQAQLFSSKQ